MVVPRVSGGRSTGGGEGGEAQGLSVVFVPPPRRQQHPDFFQWLCMERLALCCPPGTYGPDCLRESCDGHGGMERGVSCVLTFPPNVLAACAGGPQQPCSGNGRCDGEGTRGGTGLCVCSPGYGGPFCAECGDGYYEASRNQSQLLCAGKHRAVLR